MGPNLGRQSLQALTQGVVIRRGGRQSVDMSMMDGHTAPLPDPTGSWLTLETQRRHLLNLPYSRLARLVIDLDPAVNKGLFDFLRFANPAHVLENSNPSALSSTQSFIAQLNAYYGSFKSHLDSIWTGIFLTGGAFLELVLDAGGRAPADLVVNDPLSARFRAEQHSVRGMHWRLGQDTLSGFKYLDENPLIKYLGFDRLVNNPYGRPILGPSVHSSVFLLGLIQDLRRVIANVGLSRVDYSLDAEQLLQLIDRNPDIAGDDAATADFINSHISQVKDVLSTLDVDEDYVHLSTVQVNYATNPMQVNLNGIDKITETLQRNIVSGFKGVSALSNVLDSTTETHIRSQLEYYVSVIQSLQDEIADVIEQFFDSGNQVQGLQGETMFRFRKQRTADKKAIAEIEALRTETVLKKHRDEVITRDEAREEIAMFRDELEVFG